MTHTHTHTHAADSVDWIAHALLLACECLGWLRALAEPQKAAAISLCTQPMPNAANSANSVAALMRAAVYI